VFSFSETDITAQILTLEKLYDDYGLELGDKLVIKKKDSLDKLRDCLRGLLG